MKVSFISGHLRCKVASSGSDCQTIATGMTVPSQSPFARLCLETAVPSRYPATSLVPVRTGQRNKTKLRSWWTAARALLQGLFTTPSTHDLKSSSQISVAFTAAGPLVYQWQSHHTQAQTLLSKKRSKKG
jgi:hypothetical protein